MNIIRLRCCLLTDPLGIDRPSPELSWELEGAAEGSSHQREYRIRVASNPALLDTPDLWDSGRVKDSRTSFIPYAGKAPGSGAECHWRVEVWDESGNRMTSGPARWTAGLLNAGEWQGRWIGLDGQAEHPPHWFGKAAWIWSPDNAPGAHTFTRGFFLEAAGPSALGQPWLEVLADDEAEIFLNDAPLCRAARARANMNLYPGPIPLWVSPGLFRDGENCLRIEARKRQGHDPMEQADTAGVILRLCLDTRDGRAPREIVTDASWECDGGSPVILGNYGAAPWHLVMPEDYPNLRARYLRTEVDLPAAPARATLYVCGLGLFEAWLNGQRVGDEVLAPNLTDYDRRVFYRTFEVADMLREGPNALGAILGNGRYFPPRTRIPIPMQYYGCPKLLWQLEVSYRDGSRQTFPSSPDWKISDRGPVGWNSEFDGEEFDARIDFDGWCAPGFDDSGWKPAGIVAPPGGLLCAQLAEPIRVIERLAPVDRRRTKYGTTIFDFGQNLAGWCRIRASGPSGTRLRIRHAEILSDPDNLFTENLRSALCCDTVHLGAAPLDHEPRFTIHGFRYVEVREEFFALESLDLEACVVHDDVAPTADFRCSDQTINAVFAAARRGIAGNYRSIPTDCPQRDERMGWLGDRAVGAAGEMFLFDVAAFYRKWLADIRDAQMPNGCVPDVAPPYWRIYVDNVTWPACMTFVPYWLHRHFGDEATARLHFPAAKLWIDHLLAMTRNGLISRDIYGDWCLPPESPGLIHSDDPLRKAPGQLIASCYMVEVLGHGIEFAGLAGQEADAIRWREAAGAMSEAINREYYNPSKGCYANGAQTASLLPLAFGIAPEGEREKVFAHIAKEMLSSGEPVIGTGLIGAGWLMRTLTAAGRADLACEIASRTAYPSWGYMLENGATTIWELWNGNTADPAMNSANHVMLLGDLIPWLFEDLAGIQPDKPGFRSIALRPVFPARLNHVSATCRTMAGEIRSEWERSADGTIRWTFAIPANSSAKIALPSDRRTDLPEGFHKEDGELHATFGPGTHSMLIP